jgi:hypothetical protein
MLFTLEPDTIHEKEHGVLHIELDAGTKGAYEFEVKSGEEVFAGGTARRIEMELAPGDTADVDVVFPGPGDYTLRFGLTSQRWQDGPTYTVLPAPIPLTVTLDPEPIHEKEDGTLRLQLVPGGTPGKYEFKVIPPTYVSDKVFDGGEKDQIELDLAEGEDRDAEVVFPKAGDYVLQARLSSLGGSFQNGPTITVKPPVSTDVDATVALAAPSRPVSEDEVLWRFIDLITNRLRFDEFREFVMAKTTPPDPAEWRGTIAYDTLRELAEDFVDVAADPKRYAGPELPASTVNRALNRSYVKDEGKDLASPFLVPFRQGEFKFPLPNVPFVELIWNYWTEEGMLVQTLHHILAKFQNRRPGPGADPLERFDLNPLLPLRQLLWGFAEDERRRLTVRRRAAEYEYEYGLQLRGRAIPPQSMLAERRSAFVEAFHSLLYATHQFYKERDDKTIDADAFPLLSGLREVHLVLAYGAHNQFANLALQARAEMLTMQWLLAQPEMREFLGGRTMVPYEEPWMDRVDTMKSIQGWSDTSITHFFDLAFHGERILLSVRHGRWNESGRDRDDAANWALRARNSIQRYIHAYRAVTGVDLTASTNGARPPDLAAMPSDLLARRLGAQRRRA